MVACGSVSENKQTDAMLAMADSHVDTDAPSRCNSDAPFGIPQPLDTLNSTVNETGGVLSPDELTIYFSSDRVEAGSVGAFDVYIATRSSLTDPFGKPSVLAGVNTAADEQTPMVTADGLFLYMTTYSMQSDYDIALAQRANTTLNFSTPVLVPSLNSAGAEIGDMILPDHGAIYFHANRNGVDFDIYRAARNVGGTFDAATLVSIPTAYNQASAVVGPGELTIFYASTEPGGKGGYDIYMAKRSTKDDGFGVPQHVDSLSSNVDEHPMWISADGCEIYFDRQVSGRGFDVFSARRGQSLFGADALNLFGR